VTERCWPELMALGIAHCTAPSSQGQRLGRALSLTGPHDWVGGADAGQQTTGRLPSSEYGNDGYEMAAALAERTVLSSCWL
jgi:hypothetical protein